MRKINETVKDPVVEEALIQIETFCAFSLRVMAKTNVSKLRDEMRTVEIQARITGRPLLME